MLFLVVGTPWKTPRSSRFGCPACEDSGVGGKSSTRTSTLRLRLRDSYGPESSAPSTTSTKCSRVIRHRVKSIARSLRVAVSAFFVIIVIFFVVVFVIVFLILFFLLVRFFAKEDIGRHRPIRIGV